MALFRYIWRIKALVITKKLNRQTQERLRNPGAVKQRKALLEARIDQIHGHFVVPPLGTLKISLYFQ